MAFLPRNRWARCFCPMAGRCLPGSAGWATPRVPRAAWAWTRALTRQCNTRGEGSCRLGWAREPAPLARAMSSPCATWTAASSPGGSAIIPRQIQPAFLVCAPSKSARSLGRCLMKRSFIEITWWSSCELLTSSPWRAGSVSDRRLRSLTLPARQVTSRTERDFFWPGASVRLVPEEKRDDEEDRTRADVFLYPVRGGATEVRGF